MIGKTNSQVGGGIKGEKVNISLLTNQSEHSALMGAVVTVKYGESETQYAWEGAGITVTIPPYLDYEVSVSGVEGYKTPEKFTATAQDNNARSLNFEYKAERVKVMLSAVGGASMEGATVSIYGQEYTFNGTAIEVLVPFDEVYSVQGGAFGGLVAPLEQSFTASIPLREINLEYRSCVLVVNMLSNQVSDATIAALKASVAYGSTTIEVANGVMVDIPSGTDITVTFPEVENYNTPSAITFTSVNGVNEKSATYTTEHVTVNVTSNDGSGAEGQLVNVTTKGATEVIPNGVYIEDTDGYLWPTDMWNNKATPNGIAVVSDECSFVMALSDAYSSSCQWGSWGTTVSGIVTTTDAATAKGDYAGESNTTTILSQLGNSSSTSDAPAAYYCRSFTFPNGKVGYLGAAGEWQAALGNKAAIATALSKVGGAAMFDYYWTSTQHSSNGSWHMHWRNEYLEHLTKGSGIPYVRAFATLTATKLLTGDKVDSHTVKGGKAEFNMAFGTDYTVSLNDKTGYITPQAQVFTASAASRSIAMEYRFSGLKLNILSNQANDTALADVKALVTYGDTSVELGNGEMVGLSSNSEVTITFPDVPDYKTPDPITFTNTGGYIEKTGTYLTEKVSVSVSANDGASVDGQVVTVAKQSTLSNGVFIQDTNGRLWNGSSWNGSATPNGIAVVTDDLSFVVALNDLPNKLKMAETGDVKSPNDANSATDGKANTQVLKSAYGSSTSYLMGAVTAHTFPDGSKGYLWANDQLYLAAITLRSEIDNLLQIAGGTALGTNYPSSTYSYSEVIYSDYFGGTYDSNSDGVPEFDSEDNYASDGETYVRPITDLVFNPTILETHEVTSSPITFKAAHGTEYSVSVNDKTGYATPEPQSFTASEVSRAVSVVYKPYTDLSRQDIHGNPAAQNTANCYVVKQAGEYVFPIAYGAAIKNDAVNTEAFTNNGGANSHDFVNYLGNVIASPYVETDTATQAASVQISIADTDNALTDLEIIDGEGCRYVKFKVESVPATGANVVVSVKDASGVIMWNWHIWLWEDDLTPVSIVNATNVTYNILPVNLGSKWDEDAKTKIKNWFYQFGRPTPLLCPSAYNSTSNHASYGALSFTTASIAANLYNGIQNPTTFYEYGSSYNYNWFSTNSGKTYNLWDAECTTTGNSDNNVVKTVYDPCPVGFKMPNGNTFTYFSTSNVVGSFANGYKFKRYSGDTVGVFFPASGYRSLSDGSLSNVGSIGYVWLSSANSQNHAYLLYFNSSYVDPQYYNYRAFGFSVRPVQDEDLMLPTHKLTVNVSGDTQTPTGYSVSIHKVVDVTDESTGEVTETLGDVIATQTTASATHEIAWGVKYAVVASDVDGFATPSTQIFYADSNNRTVEVRYNYHPGTKNPTNGVYIQDTDGYCHTADEWTGDYTPNGVAVVTSNCRFVMALSDAYSTYCQWGSYGTTVSGIVTTTNETTAKADYAGESNTTTILNQLGNSSSTSDAPAAYYCRAFTFPNGKVGYLGAAGEWQAALDNKAAIATALSKVGGTAMSDWYWTSTQYSSSYSWYLNWDDENLGNYLKYYGAYVRAFAAI